MDRRRSSHQSHHNMQGDLHLQRWIPAFHRLTPQHKPRAALPGQLVQDTFRITQLFYRCDALASHWKHWELRCFGVHLFGSRRHQGRCAARHKQHRPWKSLERIGQPLGFPAPACARVGASVPLVGCASLATVGPRRYRAPRKQEPRKQPTACQFLLREATVPVRACLMCALLVEFVIHLGPWIVWRKRAKQSLPHQPLLGLPAGWLAGWQGTPST